MELYFNQSHKQMWVVTIIQIHTLLLILLPYNRIRNWSLKPTLTIKSEVTLTQNIVIIRDIIISEVALFVIIYLIYHQRSRRFLQIFTWAQATLVADLVLEIACLWSLRNTLFAKNWVASFRVRLSQMLSVMPGIIFSRLTGHVGFRQPDQPRWEHYVSSPVEPQRETNWTRNKISLPKVRVESLFYYFVVTLLYS